jgi:hypothetical protein
MPKFEKGSQEAKDYMASIRSKRGGSPTKCSCGKSKKKCSCADGSVAGGSANPNAPPPPPRSRPPPIITDINPIQVELEHLLELLQTQLSPRRRATIQARVGVLQQQLAGNPQSGEGIVSDAVDSLKTGATKVGQYAKAVVFGRGEAYPPKVRTLLEKYGTKTITSAELRRSPVQSLLTSAMNALTFGKFKKNMAKTPYDQLFHLQIVLTLDDGTKLLLEKNEVINMDILTSQSLAKGTEVLPITPFTSVVLNDALEKTKASMGSKAYFDYNAENNNCQDFISVFLRSNGMGDANDFAFVKQDTKKLFKGLSGLAKTAYTLTELGERANVLLTGAGANPSKIADKETEDLKERLDKKMAVAKATQSTLYKKAMKAEKEASKAKKMMSGRGGGSSKEVVIPKKDTYTQADIDKLLADNERLRMINSAIKEKKEVGISKKVVKKMIDDISNDGFSAIDRRVREMDTYFPDPPKPVVIPIQRQASADAVSNFAGILRNASGNMSGRGNRSSNNRVAIAPPESPPPSPPQPPPRPRPTASEIEEANRQWDMRSAELRRQEGLNQITRARRDMRRAYEELERPRLTAQQARNLLGLIRFLEGEISRLQEEYEIDYSGANLLTPRDVYVPTDIGSDSMTDGASSGSERGFLFSNNYSSGTESNGSDTTQGESGYKSGSGIIKPLPKGFKGSGMVRF